MAAVSCATTSQTIEPIQPSDNKNLSAEEKLRFDDWKYKGFGNELPAWVEIAIDRNIQTLKTVVPELENASKVVIQIGWGENLDQAEQLVKELIAKDIENESQLTFYDSFWVRELDKSRLLEEDKPYASVYVFYKE